MSTPTLSIIIPVYNEEHRLPKTLEQVFSFLQQQTYSYEVLVVENGSHDHTLEIAKEFARQQPQLRVLQEMQRGKGRAVRRGMLEARGAYRFMCDADFSMPVDQINRFFPPALEGDSITIASREAPGAFRHNEPHYRHVVGRLFNALIRLMALPELHDTQCGFKCFPAAAAEQIFRQQRLDGWSFDVEVLFIARRLSIPIVEIPIHWYFNPESKISVLRDSARMALDLIAIRLNALRGVYGAKV